MLRSRKTYTANRSRRTSRQVNERVVGTHVQRGRVSQTGRSRYLDSRYAAAIARRARLRRLAVAVVAVVVVLAVAAFAGFLAFRGTVDGQLALVDSDARDALVAVPGSDPSYVLVSTELGAVADPLDNAGPDSLLLVRLDPAARVLALVAVPPELQVTIDNRSESLTEISRSGDAALVRAVSSFAKVDISHFARLGEGDVAGVVDALGGIEIEVDQVIDDPHAGTDFIPAGTAVLDGEKALTYLRAGNLEFGADDRLAHQLEFAALVVERLFSDQGAFATRLESVAPYIQTDYSLAEIEGIDSWLSGIQACDITKAVVPGYFAVATNASDDSSSRYIASPSDMAVLIGDIEEGRQPSVGGLGSPDAAPPASFVVDVQNGTTVEGAAAAAAGLLESAGFSVGDVGNAEQPVFEETLVVYKDGDEGLARANAVISALGVGRAVESSAYYTFAHDVLLILGADNKPVA